LRIALSKVLSNLVETLDKEGIIALVFAYLMTKQVDLGEYFYNVSYMRRDYL